jgi:hypothetical protein
MSIRTSLNDEAYTAQVDALFASMDLDKTKSPSMNNTSTTSVQATGSTGIFGLMNYTALTGWSHQIFSDGIVFKPLDLPADEHLVIQIMQPMNFSGSLEQALQQLPRRRELQKRPGSTIISGLGVYPLQRRRPHRRRRLPCRVWVGFICH